MLLNNKPNINNASSTLYNNRICRVSLMFLSLIIVLSFLSACGGSPSSNKKMVYSFPEDTAPWERGQQQGTAETSPQGINGNSAPIADVQSMSVDSGSYARQSGEFNRNADQNDTTIAQGQRYPAYEDTPLNSENIGTAPYSYQGTQQSAQQGIGYFPPLSPTTNQSSVKVGILLPLSGKNKALGKAMMQAAQLALFDMNYTGLELIPRDTKGTASGARAAAQAAINDGAQILLGPLFSHSVQAAKPLSNQYGIPMLGFSTDWRVTGGNTFIMGVLPFTQAERIASFAAQNNWRRIGIIAPRNAYGEAVTSAFKAKASTLGLEIIDETRFTDGSNNITAEVRSFAKYDERQQLLQNEKQRLAASNQTREARNLKANLTFGPAPYDAIFIPVGGDQAKSLINLLAYYDLGTDKVAYLGTGLWDESGIHSEPAAQKAYYAAPAPQAREGFEQKYASIYGSTPPRLVSIAYDATALAVVLARQGKARSGHPDFSPQALLNPNGFAGIDGIFRFRRDGLVERALAVHQIDNGSSRVIAPAATTFQAQNF